MRNGGPSVPSRWSKLQSVTALSLLADSFIPPVVLECGSQVKAAGSVEVWVLFALILLGWANSGKCVEGGGGVHWCSSFLVHGRLGGPDARRTDGAFPPSLFQAAADVRGPLATLWWMTQILSRSDAQEGQQTRNLIKPRLKALFIATIKRSLWASVRVRACVNNRVMDNYEHFLFFFMHLLLMQIGKTFHCAPSCSIQILLHSLPLQRRPEGADGVQVEQMYTLLLLRWKHLLRWWKKMFNI